MSDSFPTAIHQSAKETAYAAMLALTSASTSLVEYQSSGHVVIIGEAQDIQDFGELPTNLSSEVISYQGTTPSDDISIEGALGQFIINVANQAVKADIVLDLSPQPLLSMALKPPGYFNTATNNVDANAIKTEIENLVGTFEKPRYFTYNESACAHGRSGQAGCTRCIDACPAQAITSLVDKIKVDPYRCQGGGICATVCPSGAIRYAYPSSEDLLTQVRVLITTYLKNGGESPYLIFVTEKEQQRAQHSLPSALVIVVEETASVGPEICLSAISWGARSVCLFDLDGMPESSRTALDLNIDMIQTILSAMNFPKTAVMLLMDTSELITRTFMPSDRTIAKHAALGDKRQAFYMALDALTVAVNSSEKINPLVRLSEGSIFGEVQVDKANCTLCMSCVSTCPSNALQDGKDLPQLGFVESKCLQCNICSNTCPENAISLSPRLLLNAEARRKPRVLHEEEPFCCLSCGKPFATKSGISTILEKLSEHAMFASDRATNRLKMCSDCRVVDMMEDPAEDF